MKPPKTAFEFKVLGVCKYQKKVQEGFGKKIK